jgi:hypothetical protein
MSAYEVEVFGFILSQEIEQIGRPAVARPEVKIGDPDAPVPIRTVYHQMHRMGK